jgi:hypothetical protein
MYQPSHFTTEIGRMRAEEMRARAERYRTIQKAKQHKKAESQQEAEEPLSRSRIFVYRKALGVVGLSLLLVLVFAAAALAMPVDAPPGVGGNEEALVSQPQVREGPPSVWEAERHPATNFEPAPVVTSNSGGRELELVLILSGALALGSAGALLWFKRQTIKPA